MLVRVEYNGHNYIIDDYQIDDILSSITYKVRQVLPLLKKVEDRDIIRQVLIELVSRIDIEKMIQNCERELVKAVQFNLLCPVCLKSSGYFRTLGRCVCIQGHLFDVKYRVKQVELVFARTKKCERNYVFVCSGISYVDIANPNHIIDAREFRKHYELVDIIQAYNYAGKLYLSNDELSADLERFSEYELVEYVRFEKMISSRIKSAFLRELSNDETLLIVKTICRDVYVCEEVR